VGSGKCPAADPTIDRQSLRRQGLDLDRSLPVPELTDVEVSFAAVEAQRWEPAEEDVARGLHQPLALDNPLAVASELALADVGLEH
jgi:hypothetical protein